MTDHPCTTHGIARCTICLDAPGAPQSPSPAADTGQDGSGAPGAASPAQRADSADRIRTAAHVMRQLARGATPGPWHSFFGRVQNGAGTDLFLTTTAGGYGDPPYLACWTPAVGELVADMLETAVEWSARDEPEFEAALELADAFLAGRQ